MNNLYNNNTPMDNIINHIITNEDNVCLKIRDLLKDYGELSNILVIHYLSIRAIYDIPPLLNISYRNKKPTTHMIFDIDKVLLAGLLLQVDCSNALLNYINTSYSEKVDKIYDIIDKYIDIDIDINLISNGTKENFQIYVDNIYKYVSEIIKILN